MKIDFTDSVPLSGVRMTDDGYLVSDAKIARTGIQKYRGSELGKPELAIVSIYRPEEEVFHVDTMNSFTHRPVTDDHPPEPVAAKNWKKFAVGQTGDGVIRDGGYVRVPLVLMDAATIEAVTNGKRELSAGYSAIIDWTPGTTPEGEAYDAVQRSIRGNHLALVDTARAGSECRIGDEANPQQKDPPMNLRKVVVDGITIETTDQSAEVIAKLQKQIADGVTLVDTKDGELVTLRKTVADSAKALEAKDGEIAALNKTHADALKAVEAKIADADKNIDARIEERQAVIADAALVAGKEIDAKGKDIATIRREAVAVAMGDEAIKGRGDEYIAASFDVLARTTPAKRDPLADSLRQSQGNRRPTDANPRAVADAAYADMCRGLSASPEDDAK